MKRLQPIVAWAVRARNGEYVTLCLHKDDADRGCTELGDVLVPLVAAPNPSRKMRR